MEMIKVHRCNRVITPRNQHVLDLAALLGIRTYSLHPKGQHIYLECLSTPSIQMVISSQLHVHENDVVISSEVFTEILIDVASGIPVNDAMLKHNILVRY